MIDILMATYNGEKYLSEQIESILNQTFSDWQLIIRDDCSKDKTMDILRKYQQKYPEKITVIEAETPSGGAAQNFFKLLDYVKNDYVMFCDQDDVWLPDKITKTIIKMQEMEQRTVEDIPILVHTDLCVVSRNLSLLNSSLFSMQKMDYGRDKLNNLLVTNIVTGCTVMINKSLLELLEVKPRKVVMHDMWIALVAAAFGRIGFVKDTTMYYRQHGSNTNGAKNVGTWEYYCSKLVLCKDVHANLIKQYNQAGEFRDIYGGRLSKKQNELLDCYNKFDSMNVFQRLYYLCKYGLFKKGFVRKLGQLLV